MPNATMRLFVCVNETGTCISIVNVLPITCRNDYRTAMTAVLNRYNTHLRYGAFILDENDGEVMFKISYAVSKESFDAAIFKQYLNCCLVVPDRAFCEISKLSVGV